MNIKEWLRNKALKWLKLEHLSENPSGERLTFINNDEEIRQLKIREYKTWYYGDDNELLNFYTSEQLYGFNKNPIYNRNKRQWFWSKSFNETDIKRVHSGLPHAIIDTMVNAIGDFKCTSADQNINELLKKIAEENDIRHLVNQQQMPLTFAEGYGAFKYIFNSDVSKLPIIEYYEAENVQFLYKNKRLIGIVFIDYYKNDKDDDFVLFEVRRIANGNSYIEYKLYNLKKNDLKEVDLHLLEETEDLPYEGYVIEGLNEVLATPSIFFFDILNQGYGRPLLEGKLTLCDDIDQALSQRSQTIRVSTPVEYYDVESMQRSRINGQPMKPSAFNRQFIAKEPMRNGDGNTMSNAIETTQPRLDFSQYDVAIQGMIMELMTGIISPATMGIDLAKRDNADAQREKEKITLMTRNNVIERQIYILRDMFKKCIMLTEYMQSGNITIQDYQIDIKYNEYATPTKEQKASLLVPQLQAKVITPEMFIDEYYGESLDDATKQRELQFIVQQQQMEEMMMQMEMQAAQADEDEI